MKSFRLISLALFCAMFFSNNSFAQMDWREPGIYAVFGGESTPLTYTNGMANSSSTNIIGVEIGKKKFSYKGTESGVSASDTLVLVINPEKKAITKSLKAYDPFIKSMTPNNIIIVPLLVDKNKRIYDEGASLEGIRLKVKGRIDFEWEQISDNSYEMRLQNIVPGEYGVIFRPATLGEFDFTGIFGFTYVEQAEAEEVPAE